MKNKMRMIKRRKIPIIKTIPMLKISAKIIIWIHDIMKLIFNSKKLLDLE